MRFTCKKFNCTMDAAACVVRQKNARAQRGKVGRFNKLPGAEVCLDCEQGREIAGQVDAQAAADYSAGLRQARANHLDYQKNAKEGQMETQVCTDERCERAGQPQPVDAFGIHGRSGQRQKICKACMSRRMREGREKKQRMKKDLQEHNDAAAMADRVRTVVDRVKGRRQVDPEAPLVRFDDHPDLLRHIVQTARQEYRTPADQLLWMVRSYQSPAAAGQPAEGV